LRLLALKYPVDDLLLEVRSADGSSASSANSASPNNASNARKRHHVRRAAALSPQPIWLAVHRQKNTVWYKRLIEEEYGLLSALAAGQPLGPAIDRAFAPSVIPDDQRPALLQQNFANWSMMGWFTR
jgi:hypothetical protein